LHDLDDSYIYKINFYF